MAMVNPMMNLSSNVKDSRWLTLEVCREFQRSKCSRTENECKFAHPPPHVEVQNGRVTACFDSIKGKCQRKEPPCKYLHPPQHLKEQLLQNGRNNLILKNLQMQAAQAAAVHQLVPGMVPTVMYETAGSKAMAYPTVFNPGQFPLLIEDGYSDQYMAAARHSQYAQRSSGLSPLTYYNGTMMPGHPYLGSIPASAVAFNPYSNMAGMPGMSLPSGSDAAAAMSQQVPGMVSAQPVPSGQQKVTRPDRLEPQVVEVLTGKKRPRDPQDDLLLSTIPGMVPYAKRMAVADNKSGVPMYQPTAAGLTAYQQALAAMQIQQQPYIPVTFTGHPPSVPRF